MIDKENVTFVIQGKLHPTGLRGVANCLKYGKVIVSSWNYCDLNLLKELGENLSKITLVLSNPNPLATDTGREGPLDCDGGIYWQMSTTLAGLEMVDTPYVIKIRGDEQFSKFDYLLQLMKTGRVVMSNRFARHTYNQTEAQFHFADTLFGGKTEVLLDAFKLLKLYLETRYFDNIELCGRPRGNPPYPLSAEQKIGISILQTLEPTMNFSECREIMKRNFLICPLVHLAPFLVNSSGWKSNGRDEFNPREWGCIDRIEDV